ncbi:MAG: (Fe-S)-binding protein [Alicyclobacillaceae bacterium]|nr:(Fe-S)-binding protein [Alicyclobacillaceae bacterium]
MADLPYEEALHCVQCGYCLPACPTYRTMGKETHSPRGRINLVRMLAEGRVNWEVLGEPMDLCLGCRACEEACPVGVPYGVILEETRHYLRARRAESARGWGDRVLDWALRNLLPRRGRLQVAGDLVWLYQRLGALGRWAASLPVWPKGMRLFAPVLPPIEGPVARRRGPAVYEPSPAGESRPEPVGRAMLFRGCVMDVMFHRINRQTGALLARFGWRVEVPGSQTCCGALHAHSGDLETAKILAKQNIAAFESSGADVVVHNAGGCGAMLSEYGRLLADEPEWAERARAFAARVKDISELAVQAPDDVFVRDVPVRVTYQSSCHLRYVEGVKDAPLKALRRIPGLEYVELEEMDRCCGSAGIYNAVHVDESMAILAEKMDKVRQTGASYVVTSNPGCLLQMRLGVRRAGEGDMEAVHLVELLARACGVEDATGTGDGPPGR